MALQLRQVELRQLADLVQGDLLGDGSTKLTDAATLATAKPGEISFLASADKESRLETTSASAILVPRGFDASELPAIQVDDVVAAFAEVVKHFRPPRYAKRIGISPAAIISPSATIGKDVDIHLGATIGDDVVIGNSVTIHAGVTVMAGCQIGDGSTLFPNAVIYDNTILGPRTIVHASAVLGSYGFGYATLDGKHILSAQLGYVEVGADVEIGAGSTIDRGTYGPTVIGEGTKIDNMVMIAHNCRIGRHNIICSQVGIAGSTTTGDYVVMAGQVGVRDHIHIGSQAQLGAKSGVVHDIPDGEAYVGVPATPVRVQALKQAALAKLPEMRKQLKQLQREVDRLTRAKDQDRSAA